MINLVVALPAEARPLIEHYRLHNKTSIGNFRIYQRDDITLIVSGIGKINAAAATAILGSRSEQDPTAWLNIGIAGHASIHTGEGRLGHSITDWASGQRWYPPQILGTSITSCAIATVDTAENHYPGDVIYDMECSAYFLVASRFTTTELVQSYKVISDNRDTPAESVTAAHCSGLISDRLDDIESLLSALTTLTSQYRHWHRLPGDLETLRQHWHFTVSQQHQLAALARRWQVMQPDKPLWHEALNSARNATAVIQKLQQQLDALPVNYINNKPDHV